MSKSYAKYKTVGICYGSNTQYYRDRQRKYRTKNKQLIKNIIANGAINEFDDLYIEFKQARKNDWDEPTDGTFKLTPKMSKEIKLPGIYSTRNKIKK